MHYCDLNLRCENMEQFQDDQDYIKLISSCIRDEYYNIALNYEYTDLSKPIKPCPFKPVELEKIEEYLKRDSSMSKYLPKLELLKQFSRITLTINETKYLSTLQETNKNVQSYDIVAVKTNNEKVFNELCINYDAFDIITSDIADKTFYMMKRGHVAEAVKKGVYFEIQYSPVLYTQESKRYIFNNFMKISKATKGKNLVITSEAKNFLQHRSPHDLVSLFNTMEVKNDDTYKALKENQLMCIQRSKYRKSFKGTVTIASDKDKEYFKVKEQQNNVRIAKKIKKQKELQSQNSENNKNIMEKLKQRQQLQMEKNSSNKESQNERKEDVEEIMKQENIIVNKKKVQKEEEEEKQDNSDNNQGGSVLGFTIDTNPEN